MDGGFSGPEFDARHPGLLGESMDGSVATSSDTGKKRFADLVRLHAQKAKFITREQEIKLLEEGLNRYDMSLADSRNIVRGVADEMSVTLERDVDSAATAILRGFASKHRNKIRKGQFEQAVAFYRLQAENALSETEIRRRVKAIMENHDWKPKRAGLLVRSRRWYRSIKLD
ncbi:hypothetical protein STVA_05120 [Allostella vacuolata]|nr:hypothetical protein STVA_05120 [Stella vacuolata]